MTDFILSNKFLAIVIITAILIILVNIIFILKAKYEKKTSGMQYAKYIIGSIDIIISTFMLLQCDAILRNNEDASLGLRYFEKHLLNLYDYFKNNPIADYNIQCYNIKDF